MNHEYPNGTEPGNEPANVGRDLVVDEWLRVEVVPAYAHAIQHPESLVSSSEIDAQLNELFVNRRVRNSSGGS